MKMAILTLEKAIRDREQKLESFAQVIKDNEDSIADVSVLIQGLSLQVDELKLGIEILKNA
jgi:hypothetical protein